MIVTTEVNKDDKSQSEELNSLKKKLFESNVIVYVNEFTEASAKKLYDDVSKAHQTGQSVIPVVIDSYGGYVDALVSMIDVLKSSELPIATICVGKAMSCGSILLTCGAEGRRFIAPNARVMVHHVSSFSWGKVAELKVDVAETERLQKQVFGIMAQNCGKHESYFLDLISNNLDLYMSPQECLKHNMVQHIRVPKFKIEVSVKTELT